MSKFRRQWVATILHHFYVMQSPAPFTPTLNIEALTRPVFFCVRLAPASSPNIKSGGEGGVQFGWCKIVATHRQDFFENAFAIKRPWVQHWGLPWYTKVPNICDSQQTPAHPFTYRPIWCSRRCRFQTELLRAALGSASYAPISSRLNNNGYKGLRYTGRPDKMGASLGLSGDGSAEAAPGMAAILASRGPLGPILAFRLALRVILASWFPIQVGLCTPL